MPHAFAALLALTLARLREFYRDPVAVFWVHAFPLFVMLTLGWAFSRPAAQVLPVDIVAGEHAWLLFDRLRGNADLQVRIHAEADARARLRRAECSLLLYAAAEPPFPAEFDPARPDSLLAAARVAAALTERGFHPLALTEIASVRYIAFLVPGLLGVGLMGGGLVGMGYVLVDMRRRGLLKRLRATPVRPWQVLASLMLARAVFLLPEAGLLLLFSWLLFGVVTHGSAWLLAGLILLGALQFLALGLLLGARLRTTEAISGLVSLLMLTQWVFCGVFFSNRVFPPAAWPWLDALPLTPLVAALRGVMLERATTLDLTGELARMAAWTVFSLTAGLYLFATRAAD